MASTTFRTLIVAGILFWGSLNFFSNNINLTEFNVFDSKQESEVQELSRMFVEPSIQNENFEWVCQTAEKEPHIETLRITTYKRYIYSEITMKIENYDNQIILMLETQCPQTLERLSTEHSSENLLSTRSLLAYYEIIEYTGETIENTELPLEEGCLIWGKHLQYLLCK